MVVTTGRLLKHGGRVHCRIASHRGVPPHVARVDPVPVPGAGVDLEADVVEGFAVLLPLRQRDDHRAHVLAVERVRVVQVDEVLRVAGELFCEHNERLI